MRVSIEWRRNVVLQALKCGDFDFESCGSTMPSKTMARAAQPEAAGATAPRSSRRYFHAHEIGDHLAPFEGQADEGR